MTTEPSLQKDHVMIPDIIEISGTPNSEDSTWQELDPWGAAPEIASKLPGFGGTERSPDPAFVFETAFFSVAPGPVRIRLMMEGASDPRAVFLVQLSNRSDLAGSPSVRLRLMIAALDTIADADGVFDVTVEAEPNTQYALSAFLHADEKPHVTALRIFVDRPARVAADSDRDSDQASDILKDVRPAALQARTASRLIESGLPSFTNPYSQPWTPSQQQEPAYAARCGELGLDTEALESWSQAFVLQALARYAALSSDRCGIGFDCAGQALPWSLLHSDARILMTRFDEPGAEADLGAELVALKARAAVPPTAAISFTTLAPSGLPTGYYGAFDFGWWIAPQNVAVSDIVRQLNAITTALKPGGTAVLVLPFQPGRIATAARADNNQMVTRQVIERTALEVIAQGHSIVQLRFGPPRDMPGASRFGLIVARS